jgi:hypothetical protein
MAAFSVSDKTEKIAGIANPATKAGFVYAYGVISSACGGAKSRI